MSVHRVEVESSRYAILACVAAHNGKTPKKFVEEWINQELVPEADRIMKGLNRPEETRDEGN